MALHGVVLRGSARKSSVFAREFFEKSKLELWQVLGLSYIQCLNAGSSRGMSVEHVMHELCISSNITVIDWNQFFRDVTVEYFLRNPEQIGGPNRIVEIDESYLLVVNTTVDMLQRNSGYLVVMSKIVSVASSYRFLVVTQPLCYR